MITFPNGSTIWTREYNCKLADKSKWTVKDWESLHRIKPRHRKNYPNAVIAYENKRVQRQITNSPLFKAMQEN